MNIVLRKRQVYGNTMYYPANEAARVVTCLTGRRTLSKSDIDNLKQLGHECQLEQEEL